MRKHHVKIYSLIKVSDGMGSYNNYDVLLDGVLANIYPQKSKEVIENMRLDAPSILKINISFRDDIKTNMKVLIVKSDKLYEIVAEPIDKDTKNKSLDILLKESDSELVFQP